MVYEECSSTFGQRDLVSVLFLFPGSSWKPRATQGAHLSIDTSSSCSFGGVDVKGVGDFGESSRNPRGGYRRRPGGRSLSSARERILSRGKHSQRQSHSRAARHAVGLCRYWPGSGRVPLCLGLLRR